MVLESLEPKLVWHIFENVFTKTPRCSKKEDKVRKVLKDFSEKSVAIGEAEMKSEISS